MKLTEVEIDSLQLTINNPIAMSALKKVFEDATQKHLPCVVGFDDVVIGQQYRAYNKALDIIDEGFKNVLSYSKDNKESQGGINHR